MSPAQSEPSCLPWPAHEGRALPASPTWLRIQFRRSITATGQLNHASVGSHAKRTYLDKIASVEHVLQRAERRSTSKAPGSRQVAWLRHRVRFNVVNHLDSWACARRPLESAATSRTRSPHDRGTSSRNQGTAPASFPICPRANVESSNCAIPPPFKKDSHTHPFDFHWIQSPRPSASFTCLTHYQPLRKPCSRKNDKFPAFRISRWKRI